MVKTSVALIAMLLSVHVARAGEQLDLPPEVTPALRSACESDVRRLCIGADPTVSKVKACIAAKFMHLGKRCQIQIALAGLKP